MNLLVTGGAGFVGSNFIRLLLRDRPGVRITNLDLLTYAGNPANLAGVRDDPRYTFVQGDICDVSLVRKVMDGRDAVVNLAAETHVDRSVRAPGPFVRTNVLGTQVLLDAAREAGVDRFLQVSTDEVYGELPWFDPEETVREGIPRFRENSPLRPRSPYSASKASADLLVLAHHASFSRDVVVARGSNNYGPRQHPEKLIPLMVTCALRNTPLPVYGDGLNVRDWLHVEDFGRGLLLALEKGRSGEVYNFGGDAERTNLQVVREILDILQAPEELIAFVEDRPGHDRRYAVDHGKATRELGWEPSRRFGPGLEETVRWYAEGG